jgi:di/tricarboxylate transporter
MSIEAWITLAILLITFTLLFATKLPAVVVFLGAMTAILTLDLAPVDETLKGFSNSGVLTVGVLFMVAAGMYSTGAITLIVDRLVGLPKSLLSAYLRILPAMGIGSAFLNNTPLVAMMIPTIRDLCRITRLSASKLYIPLSFASILGGAATLIGTSTNLIIAGLVADTIARADPNNPALEEVTIFLPSLVGVPAAVVGIAFIILTSRWLLPDRKQAADDDVEKRRYGAEFVLKEDSRLVGITVESAGFAFPEGYELTSVRRADGSRPEISSSFELQAGDVLTFSAETEALPSLWSTIGLTPLIAPIEMDTERYQHRLVEVVVSEQHPAVSHKVSELPVRQDPSYDAMIVAMSRNGQPPDRPLPEVRIAAGDNAVLEVDDTFFYETRNEIELSLIRRLRGYRIKRIDRAIAATVITVLMVAAAALGWLSMLNAALLASGALLVFGCMTLRAAGRSVEWDTLVVLAAAISLEAAVTASGLATKIAEVLETIGGGNPYVALVLIFLGAIILTNVVTNAAAAAIMYPITLSLAADLGVSFTPFVVTLMMGCSYAFINPAGYQTNLMVFRPGGYQFSDFAKIGVPLTLVAGAVVIVLAPIVYGF